MTVREVARDGGGGAAVGRADPTVNSVGTAIATAVDVAEVAQRCLGSRRTLEPIPSARRETGLAGVESLATNNALRQSGRG